VSIHKRIVFQGGESTVLLGTDRDADGVPWALLASDRNGVLEFAGPAILNPPKRDRESWAQQIAVLAIAKPPVRGLRQGTAQWLRPELRVRVQHLKAKGTLRHATVKQFISAAAGSAHSAQPARSVTSRLSPSQHSCGASMGRRTDALIER
jgi:hypothetical protein